MATKTKTTSKPSKPSKPKVISLFSGAGGLDYGLEAAGFETGAAVEMDHECCETMRQSRTWPVIESDIFKVTTEQILEAAGVRRGEVALVAGGPPCQPFSKAGYWKRGDSLRLGDPRAATLEAYLRVVEEAQPHVFLLENVEGLAFSGKDEGVQFLLDQISTINKRTGSKYRPVYKVVNAADYGVPQMRGRFLLVAARDGREFVFPEPTHQAPSDPPMLFDSVGLPPYRTAWDAIGDVVPDPSEDLAMRGKWAALLPTIPEGDNYLVHTAKRGSKKPLFGWRRHFWSFLLKLAKNRPSWTLQAQPGPSIGPFHWKNRRLSMRELCRLQTFPDDVLISGGRTAVQKQLGNAVPSLLAEIIGRAIRTQLLGLPALKGEPALLPPDRSPAPAPEAVARIPKEFLPLVGDYEAHPGTGLGYGAQTRSVAIE